MRKTSVQILCLVALLLISACAPATPAQQPTTQATDTAAAPTAAATETVAETPTTVVTEESDETPTAGAETPEGTAAPDSGTASAGEGEVVSIRAETAPELDGAGQDDAWANAPETVIETQGGENESATEVSVKSVYDDEKVYFLLSWQDPTQSWLRSPWELQEDNTWKKLSSPQNRGGDENEFYEDKMALIWPINDSIPNFDTQGCFTACHAGENADVKPYGNKYTDEPGQTGDIWHWKSVRQVAQVDDQYLDNTPYSPDTPEAGRKSDPNTGGGYKNNDNEDQTTPAFMSPDGGDKTGAPGSILDTEKVPFDPSLFQPGDRVPGVVIAPFEGDRGDISAGWTYENGTWTLEFSRNLTTGSEFDVQFDDLSKTFYFGLATFDNAQVRHAFQTGSTPFVFIPNQ